MLDINNITVVFQRGSGDEHKVLDNLSIHLNKGDFVTIIGSNGAGKSTLMNAVGGSVFTETGKIILDGEDITLMPEHIRSKRIGRLFQDPMKGTAPGMTVEENLALAAGCGGWFSCVTKKDRKMFKEKLARLGMGLEDRLEHQVGLLSGGQRQALTLMMATYNAPKLLLLDEHTAALDPATAEKVLKITKEVVEENNITCMMITHNMENALEFGNRTIMMHKGDIIFDTSGEERQKTTVSDLMEKFRSLSGGGLNSDRMLLN